MISSPNSEQAMTTRPTPPNSGVVDRLLKIREVEAQSGMGKTAIYEGIKAKTFPSQVKNGRSARWLQSEIQQFIADRAAARRTKVVAGNSPAP